jgi:hypothetical protein
MRWRSAVCIVEQLTDVAILLANAIFAFSHLLLRLLQLFAVSLIAFHVGANTWFL